MKISEGIDRLSCKIGGHKGLFVFGLPFFLMGSFFFWGGLTAEKINDGPASIGMRLVFCSFSSIFILIGLSLMAGFKKYIIDKRQKTLTKAWGILIPLYWKVESLEEVESIESTVEVRISQSKNSGSSRRTVYPVRLLSDDKKETLAESQNLLESRQLSEGLSRFLQVPINDSSLGESFHREPGDLDKSIKEMMAKNNERIEAPQLPQSLKNSVSDGYNNHSERCTHISLQRLCSIDPVPFYIMLGIFSVAFSAVLYKLLTFESQNNGSKFFFDVLDHHFTFLFIVPTMISLAVLPKVLKGLVKIRLSLSPTTLNYTRSLLLPMTKTVDLQKIEHLLVKKINRQKNLGCMTLVADDLFLNVIDCRDFDKIKYIEQLIKYKVQQG